MAALWEAAAAASPSANTFTVRVTGPSVNTDAIRALAAHVRPGVWVVPDAAGTTRSATAQDVAHLLEVDVADVGAVPGPTRTGTHLGPARVCLSRKGRTVTARLLCDPVEVPLTRADPVKVGTARLARLVPIHAAKVLAALSKAGLVVVDADSPGRLADLGWVTDRRLLITPAPGAAGWANVDAGPLVTSSMSPVLSAPDAVAGARPAAGKVAVALDPVVLAAGAIAGAAAVPSPTPGVVLRAWQEQFIGRYLASPFGLLNALPPGAGKTACVAGAMAAAAAADSTHRGLVVVPAILAGQWVTEFATFHPGAHVVVANTEDDLDGVTRAWKRHAPVVAITSPNLLAKHPEHFAALRVDDLAVDEGTYLRGDSAQTRALWQIRRTGPRTAVLTGTPDSGMPGTVEAIVGFVTGRPHQPGSTVDTALVGLGPVERAGVWVFGAGAEVAADLPTTAARLVPVPATEAHTAVQAAALERVAATLASATTDTARRKAAAKLKAELDGWRTGLACPAALLTGASALGKAVRAHLGTTGVTWDGAPDAVALARAVPGLAGAKVAWAAQWVADGVTAGEQSLVFADSVPALEILADQLSAAGVRAGLLTGKVRPSARARAIAEFVGGGLDVLLVAPGGQLGLNLQVASRVAHLDVPASAASLVQRSARAARMGATHANIDVLVPLVTGTAESTWWTHASGARAAIDVLGLAAELTSATR